MKNLLNFGVSDPLTLGMSHPVADRLETLGREKTLTNRGRATVLGIMGGLAVLSAHLRLPQMRRLQRKTSNTNSSRLRRIQKIKALRL